MTTPPNHNTADQSGADERERFEHWCKRRGNGAVRLKGTDQYLVPEVQSAWIGWKAGAEMVRASEQSIGQFHPMGVAPAMDGNGVGKLMVDAALASTQPAPAVPAGYINKSGLKNFYVGNLDAIDPAFHWMWQPLYATPQPFPAPAVQEHKDCSGDSASCPENEGYGCCKPNPAVQSGELLEITAKAIYESFAKYQDGFKPWVDGGNSLKQDEAREYARQAIAQTAPAVAGEARNANNDLLTYVLQDDVHNRLTPRVIDIAYTAFMQAKRPNDEDGGASDWFTDTRPVVLKAIEKLRKDLLAEGAKHNG